MLYLQFTETSYVYCMINIIQITRYGIYIIQNTIYRYPDKMPLCKWCTKDAAKVLQGRDKSVTGV